MKILFSNKIRFVLLQNLFLAIAVLAFFQISPAATVRKAQIRDQQAQVQLYFSDSIEKMFELFSHWEQHLEQEGLQARFFLAAGDLRRALLFSKIEGPGDLEILIHLENLSLKPLRVTAVLQLLKEKGVTIEQDLKKLFGPQKKLDIFVKDQWGLSNGRGYTGEFGEFAEMGDTSVNELRYSPSLNMVDGKSENLVALSHHQIRYLETDKIAKKEKPTKIPGLKGESYYSPMILRMALRSLRLETEILLSENPNQLTLDHSFHEVLLGFELFFDTLPIEEVRKYAINEIYLEQFKKLFRNRSLAENKKLLEFLELQHPKTLALWRTLGLDYGVFLKNPRKEVLKNNREFRAVVNNARYNNLRPFLDKDFSVTNPFKEKKSQALLLELCQSARSPENQRLIPLSLLERYSPKTFRLILGFDELNEDEKLQAVEGFIDATKYFAGNAYNRLFKEKSFIDHSVRLFQGLRANLPDKKSNLSLLDWLPPEIVNTPNLDPASQRASTTASNLPAASTLSFSTTSSRVSTFDQDSLLINTNSLANLQTAVSEALRARQIPTLVVDLDKVVFLSETRLLAVLHDYDIENQTNYFRMTNWRDLTHHSGEEQLYALLSPKLKSMSELKIAATKVAEYLKQNQWRDKYLLEEFANPQISRTLKDFAAQGVQMVYLTARPVFMQKTTILRMKELGLPEGHYIFNDSTLGVGDFKIERMRDYQEGHPLTQWVGVLDDKRTNGAKLRAEFPTVPVFQIVYDYRETDSTENQTPNPRTFWLERDDQIYDVFGWSLTPTTTPESPLISFPSRANACKDALQTKNH